MSLNTYVAKQLNVQHRSFQFLYKEQTDDKNDYLYCESRSQTG